MMRFLTLSLAVLLLLVMTVGCSKTPTAQIGDRVKVHYTGTFENGEQFDSSRDSEPLEFTVGSGQMIKGFNDAVVGMKVGETKEITLTPEDAYGPVRQELIINVPRSQFPPDFKPEKGQQLQTQGQDGRPVYVTVEEFTDDSVKINGNHPMAGKTLHFEIELVDIVKGEG